MEQLSFFRNEVFSNKLRRHIINIRDRVDQSASIVDISLVGSSGRPDTMAPQFSKLPVTMGRLSGESDSSVKRLVLRDATNRNIDSMRDRKSVV